MPTPVLASIASILAAKAVEHIGSQGKLSKSTIEALNSFVETIFKKLKENKNTQTRAVIASVEQGNLKVPTEQSLEIIAESIEEEINENPEFAKEVQEKIKHLLEQIKAEDPDGAEEINIKEKDFSLKRLQKLQSVNISDTQESISSSREKNNFIKDGCDNTNIDDISIDDIRDSLIKLIPVENRLQKLEKLRQPKPILDNKTLNRLQIFLTIFSSLFPIPIILEIFDIGNIYISFIFFVCFIIMFFVFLWADWIDTVETKSKSSKFKKGENKNENKEKSIPVDEDPYLEQLRELENEFQSAKEDKNNKKQMEKVKQELRRLNDNVKLRTAISYDLFISFMYSAYSSNDLVANMASKIGHKELRDEADMHLSIIIRFVGKLNKIAENLDIERLTDSKDNKIDNQESDSASIVKALMKNVDANLETFIINYFANKAQEKNKEYANKDEEKKGKSIYILSEESQVAVGIMSDIEERRLIVEKLVRSDQSRQNKTILMLFGYMVVVIVTIIVVTNHLSSKFGSNSKFIVGNDLEQTKLAFLGVPWPVVLWSLIGSFAAMIVRFNRQPIYDFTDTPKWMITRPIQGVVLGSAFYLVLTSGLFLLTGGASASISGGAAKVTTEVILVLSFLVGFSDKFADSVFNALVDKYSGKESKTTEDSKDSDRSKKSD